jgi:hypothetical protein
VKFDEKACNAARANSDRCCVSKILDVLALVVSDAKNNVYQRISTNNVTFAWEAAVALTLINAVFHAEFLRYFPKKHWIVQSKSSLDESNFP